MIAAKGADFIILGADSRGTMTDIAGNRVELNLAVKLIQITDHIAFLVYGDAHISDYLIEKFKEKLTGKTKSVSEVAEEFAEFCRAEVKKTKDVPRDYIPNFGFIIAGLDFKGKITIPRCYKLRSMDGFELGIYRADFAIAGKYIIATYLFSKEFKQDMSVEQLSSLTAKAIYDTSTVDGDVGGEIKMARIDEYGYTPYQSDIVDGYTIDKSEEESIDESEEESIDE